MALTWNGDEVLERIRGATARGLLRAAVYFQQAHRERLSVPNPVPHTNSSKPGEYPRLRTGHGRASVDYSPKSVAEVEANGLQVRVGYRRIIPGQWGNYLLILERNRQRLGLLNTLRQTMPQLRALAAAGA